jgi:hypothetical protein
MPSPLNATHGTDLPNSFLIAEDECPSVQGRIAVERKARKKESGRGLRSAVDSSL